MYHRRVIFFNSKKSVNINLNLKSMKRLTSALTLYNKVS